MSLQSHEPTKVFVCYSHKDAKWLDRLKIHLRPIVREREVEIWDDTMITPGSTWLVDIKNSIAVAKLAILLISADFLASDFIATNELPRLLQKAKTHGIDIIPVIVSPSGFLRHPILSQFQAVNDPQRPLVNLKKGMQEVIWERVVDAVRESLRDKEEKVVNIVPTDVTISADGNNDSPVNNPQYENFGAAAALNEGSRIKEDQSSTIQYPKDQGFSGTSQKYISVILAAVTTLLVTVLVGYLLWPPGDPDDFVQIDKADVFLDLTSAWRVLTESQRTGEVPLSKATLKVNFLARKFGKNSRLNHRLGTTSLLSKPFEWRSDPRHPIEIEESSRKCSPEVRLSYMLYFDIREERVNAPFNLSYEIDFWNAHNRKLGDWHAFYVSKPTSNLTFTISFPRDKPYTGIKFLTAEGLDCDSPFDLV